MLASILKQEYGRSRKQQLRKLYETPSYVISGCLFQSFDQFTKNVILRFIANEGQLSDKKLMKDLNPNDPNVGNELKEVFMRLQELAIIDFSKMDNTYKIFKGFSTNLQKYIMNPLRLPGSQLPPGYKNQMQQFDLLCLLYQGNPILDQCKLTRINWHYAINALTKDNFDYIRAPVYEKIGILIKGYLRFSKNKASLNDILTLSLLDPNRAYKVTDKNFVVVKELESLKLLKRISESQFVVSDYLHNFAFHSKRASLQKKGSLKCKIIIETNFKVYTQVQSNNSDNYEMIKSILKSLIQIQHQDYNFEELVVGSITKDKMLNLFRKGITAGQFFDFFEQYMEKSHKLQEKDLGKWNKIKFLGLEGINSESAIPNNVRQEIKLWENLEKHKDFYGEKDFDSDEDGSEGEQTQTMQQQGRRR